MLDKSEVGPALYLILPSAYEPVSLRRALRTLLSEDFVKKLRERLEAVLLETDGGFLQQPPPEQDVLHQQREGLRQEMQGVVTLRSTSSRRSNCVWHRTTSSIFRQALARQ